MHVVVVDDEPEVRDLVRDYLSRYEFIVSAAATVTHCAKS